MKVANRHFTDIYPVARHPLSIDPAPPEHGTRLEFDGAVQIDGDRPMAITLNLRKASQGGLILALLLCLAAAANEKAL